ncbi:hypothetical protein I6A60_17100 [Frankia sp. AgB1.9]|uniref:GH116 family glycosyl-hydrolase n=1 Tax=unclassified Frankia TaxID=2632575 RepID=UPI0019313478|nr:MULTISPECIES: GH116 family glycosyl-hydrolase [unclassified Frankia]MBL7549580.1 hypothetical protein [Frankia sp. AgB1.9]
MTRRSFVGRGVYGAAALAAAGGGLSLLSCDRERKVPPAPSSWEIPEAAFVRTFGEAPGGICSAIDDQQCAGGPESDLTRGFAAGNGLSVPGLGIPLGGVGAGSFMYNLFGTFGPWDFGGAQDMWWEQRILPQAAFHVREQVAGQAPTVRTLTTPHDNVAVQRKFGSVLPAWNQLRPGDGTYGALFPFGWLNFRNAVTSDVSLRFWSPIVAHEDERTSMPVAFFDVLLKNPSSQPAQLSVMFTFPNAAPQVNTTPATVRQGLYTRFTRDQRSGVAGLTLGADDPANTVDAASSEWTIAALPAPGQTVSYVSSGTPTGTAATSTSCSRPPAPAGTCRTGRSRRRTRLGRWLCP